MECKKKQNDEIKDIPRLRKLREDAQNFQTFKKFWPLLRPFFKILGADTKSIDETLSKVDELAKQTYELVTLPERYNKLFSEQGWIFFEFMDIDVANEAIEIAEKVSIEKADEFLTDYFTPMWVETQINRLEYLKGFSPRFDFAKKALEDYKAGRYYASVLVILSLLDGWVNELYINGFERHGFFSEKSQLVAWNSITAHPNGLMKIKDTFNKSRQMTRSDEIRIPYRNGIVHGMDLGYDNKFVAAKCWAALFAVRDWASKAARNELEPPYTESEVEKTLWEIIEDYQNTKRKVEELKQWQPRVIAIGETIPPHGSLQEYPQNSPEKKVIEFLSYWQEKNYGFMAKCREPLFDFAPEVIREKFGRFKLENYSLTQVSESTPTVADVDVNVFLSIGSEKKESIISFRVVGTEPDGKLAYFLTDDVVWCISIWRHNL